MWLWLSIAGLAIIATLAFVALRTLQQLKAHQHQRDANRRELAEYLAAQREHRLRSITLLARAVLEDERLTLTEGCLRISALMNSLSLLPLLKSDYLAIHQLAQATRHIPIREQWKALSATEQQRYDSERLTLEKKFIEPVRQACQDLLSRNLRAQIPDND